MAWWRKKPKTPSPARVDLDPNESDDETLWDSRIERQKALDALDSTSADGYLDPEAAAKLAEELRPVAEEQFNGDFMNYDPRVYSTVAAAEHRAGSVDDQYFTEYVEQVKQLKRDGRLDEALQLLMKLVRAAERGASGREPAPWYTEQAAIVLRKLKDLDGEVAVLERYVAACPPGRSSQKIEERLMKARSLREAQRGDGKGR